MRRAISSETWDQIKTAYAAGIGLREVARNMQLPAGTVLARAKREGWTRQVQIAKSVVQPQQSDAITPMQSAAVSMQQRGERYTERIAGISERVTGHIETMKPAKVLDSIHEVEKFDRMARRTYGLRDDRAPSGILAVNILTNHAAVQFVAEPKKPVDE